MEITSVGIDDLVIITVAFCLLGTLGWLFIFEMKDRYSDIKHCPNCGRANSKKNLKNFGCWKCTQKP